MKKSKIDISATNISEGKIRVSIKNAKDNPVAFFNRLSMVNAETRQRILPAFYSDNYVSVLPGEEKIVVIDYTPGKGQKAVVEISGWNVERMQLEVK